MTKMLNAISLACCLVALQPARADYSALQASTSGVSGQTVTVAVHNPTAGSVAARVRVVVKIDDDTFFILMSSNFTVAAGGTSSVSLTAPAPVAEIVDDPEPFPDVH